MFNIKEMSTDELFILHTRLRTKILELKHTTGTLDYFENVIIELAQRSNK